MGTKAFLILLIGALVLLSGCTAAPGGEGSLEILVSDEPTDISDFTYLNVYLSEVRVFKTNSTVQTYQPSVGSFDLTKLEGDNALSLINATLEEGRYTKIEFHVTRVEGETSEGVAEIVVPSNKLMITKNFDVAPDTTVSFVFDISTVKRGQTNSYNLLPVISESGVVGKDIPESRVRRVTREQARAHTEGPGTGQGETARLTIQEARSIAQGTECTQNGSLEEGYTYNENSRTWWIDVEMNPENEQEGCNPACVVSDDDESVEINWRCTGAMPPDSSTGQFTLTVKDAPADIGDFSELMITLSGVRIHHSDGIGEWLEFTPSISQFDLTELVDGNTLEVLGINLEEGMYTQIVLLVESAVGMVGDQTINIRVPGNTLKIVKPFLITPGGEIEFIFDINVAKKGNNMGYNLLPVIGQSGVWDSQNQNPTCGNGLCEVNEDNETCPEDCLIEVPICGDGTIDEGEDCDGTALAGMECTDFGYTEGNISCSYDCEFDLSECINETVEIPICGNDICEEGENYTNCPEDCGPPAPVCGNDICEEGENYTNCPEDCTAPVPECIAEINCTDYCESDVLFINGTCVDDACVFANITCDFGCEDAACINQTV